MSKREDTILIQADYAQSSIFIDIESAIWTIQDIDKLFETIWNFCLKNKDIDLEITSCGKKKQPKQLICWVSSIDLLAPIASELVDRIKKELPSKDIKFSNLNKYD